MRQKRSLVKRESQVKNKTLIKVDAQLAEIEGIIRELRTGLSFADLSPFERLDLLSRFYGLAQRALGIRQACDTVPEEFSDDEILLASVREVHRVDREKKAKRENKKEKEEREVRKKEEEEAVEGLYRQDDMDEDDEDDEDDADDEEKDEDEEDDEDEDEYEDEEDEDDGDEDGDEEDE